MKHTIDIRELVSRQTIRTDKMYEFLNKMTDEEIAQYDKETDLILLNENTIQRFPDWNYAITSKNIDSEIMYKIFKIDSENK